MAWLGSIILLIIYSCFFAGCVARRWEWFFITIWTFPVLGMCLNDHETMEMNGLMVLLCMGMFLLTRKGVESTKMWNIRRRKIKEPVVALLFLVVLFVVFYSAWESQVLGYLPDFQGLRKGKIDLVLYFLTSLPLLGVVCGLTFLSYNGVDRLWGKKEELILLECRYFISSEHGSDRAFNKGFFVDGINNGESYHFRMTKRMYDMIRREKILRLQVKKGLLGGLYVEKNPYPENEKKTRKRDRKILVAGSVATVLVLGLCIFLFWMGK